MKKWVLLGAAAMALVGAAAAPSQADTGNMIMRTPVTIKVEGITYEGVWAFVGERPYVGVESFGNALGYPRVHNVKGWSLNPPPPRTSGINPLVLAVEAGGKNIPTTRFGGATMCDLQTACDALDIPYHYDFERRIFEVDSPYRGEIMKGALYRWWSNHYDWYYSFSGERDSWLQPRVNQGVRWPYSF
ncbi:MAG: hypothetical protein AMXMBFR33_60690 [Candidatus Xenobia bacterium]